MISIIIPTLEEAKVIGQTIARLKKELTLPHEIIVSDGGSTDDTAAIARGVADSVVVHDGVTRQTIAQGRNDGARLARGDFLVFIDADCVIPEPDRFFERALAQFAADEHMVALTVNLCVFPGTETLGDRLIVPLRNKAVRFVNNTLRRGECAGGEFQMVRRAAFETVGGYRAELVTCEDRDLFMRLAKIGRTKSDGALTVYHSGRRPHIEGWPRLIARFFVNSISFSLRGRPVTKEWKPVR